MNESLDVALARVTEPLRDANSLIRAVASGRRRGEAPSWRRVELRYVDLKAGRTLQITAYDDTQAHISNHAEGAEAAQAVADLTAEPFGNWHVESTTETHQLRVTKRGAALVHTESAPIPDDLELQQVTAAPALRGHDREKERLLPEDDPVFAALGLSDSQGRIKPSRQAKYRQVEDFLRILDTTIGQAIDKGHLRRPTPDEPLRIVDLGCGNAYLTLAAHRYLTTVRGWSVRMTGVDTKEQSRAHNSQVAAGLGIDADFVLGSIDGVELGPAPEVVLALHACDTATDDALARALEWQAPVVLAAPCCHHDLAAQIKGAPSPAPYGLLTRDGILRERFADTLTDAVRSALLRARGYRVEVMAFVESKHTPRNTMLRAVRTGSFSKEAAEQYDALVAQWQVRPKLAELLANSMGPGGPTAQVQQARQTGGGGIVA